VLLHVRVLVNYFIAGNIVILFRFQRICEVWLLNDQVIVSTFLNLASHFLPMLHTVSKELSGLEAPTVAVFCDIYISTRKSATFSMCLAQQI
jgi:hypothetical protein